MRLADIIATIDETAVAECDESRLRIVTRLVKEAYRKGRRDERRATERAMQADLDAALRPQAVDPFAPADTTPPAEATGAPPLPLRWVPPTWRPARGCSLACSTAYTKRGARGLDDCIVDCPRRVGWEQAGCPGAGVGT